MYSVDVRRLPLQMAAVQKKSLPHLKEGTKKWPKLENVPANSTCDNSWQVRTHITQQDDRKDSAQLRSLLA